MVTLTLQHVQILVGIHDPGYWPGPIWKRCNSKQPQTIAAPGENDRQQALQSFPSTRVGEGESTHGLVSSPQHDADSESVESQPIGGFSVDRGAEVEVESSWSISEA